MLGTSDALVIALQPLPLSQAPRAICGAVCLALTPGLAMSSVRSRARGLSEFTSDRRRGVPWHPANGGSRAPPAPLSPQQEQNIKPQFFAFRWLTLLLSQEFLLPDVIRIWDSLFADDNRFDFLLLVCCAMLM